MFWNKWFNKTPYSRPEPKTWKSPACESWNIYREALNVPHVLVVGSTGAGKSVIMNGLIAHVLHRFPLDKPNGAKMILIDPKRVELARYRYVPHTLQHASGHEPKAWLQALEFALALMDKRYEVMERNRELLYGGGDVYVFIDEWADLASSGGKACKNALLRLASEGRAARVHVVLATQFPVATILSTPIRGNFAYRFALRTNNKLESRIAMDAPGCEELPNHGQGYWCKPGKDGRILYNIPMVQESELDRLVRWWEDQA